LSGKYKKLTFEAIEYQYHKLLVELYELLMLRFFSKNQNFININ